MSNKLIKLMAEILGVKEKEVTNDFSITNTEAWDSLKHMELVVAIEETFRVQLTTDEIVTMVNISAIKQVLKKRGVKI